MIKINHKSSHPIYLQIANTLRTQIQEGRFKPDQALPGERELSNELKINRRTISKALDILEEEGLVYKIRGSGVFIEKKEDFLSFINTDINSKVVALSTPESIENSHAVDMIKGAISYLEEKNIQSLRINYIRASEEKEHITLNRHILSGIIMYPKPNNEITENIKYFQSLGLPLVVIGNLSGDDFDSVRSKDEDGAREAVGHFIKTGHERIIFFPVDDKLKLSSKRLSGYEAAMAERGLLPEIIKYDKTSNVSEAISAGYELAMKIFKKKKYPTAILTQNDMLAIGVYKALLNLKIRVPEDVELIGFGNDIEASILFPDRKNPISTVAVDRAEIGRKAAEVLTNRIANPSGPFREILTSVKLLHRRTTRQNE